MVNGATVTAFIPVRGGSKSIPLKNIRPFCGKPLVCWNIEALEACPQVDAVVVATDSDAIEKVVLERGYAKTTVFRRGPENATDTASTESVMLEYLSAANLPGDSVFMLVQATSPLTETVHFQEALALFATGRYDSLLSCVRVYRFFWDENGASVNYDYRNRPRRQEFKGNLMENGAFYINTVSGVLQGGNRLGGRIGVYEMPAYTATEIDEPDDWTVLENLKRRHMAQAGGDKPIRLFLCDVDGTLTDGGMYYSEMGDELKKFNTRDGMGFQLLREAGVKTGIITSENTKIVENRARKLKMDFLVQSQRDGGKLKAAQDICAELGIPLSEVAYLGDDVNCRELLCAVGLAGCPADAQPEIKALPGIHVMESKGGEGCAREFSRLILERNNR